MKFFKSFSDGKGGLNTFEWSLEEGFLYALLTFLVVISIIFMMVPFLPIPLLLFYMFSRPLYMKIICVVNVVIGGLFLLDYSIGGIFWSSFIHMPKLLDTVAIFEGVSILINIYLFFYAKSIFREINYQFNRQIMFFLLIIAFGLVVLAKPVKSVVVKMRSETKYGTEVVEK